VIGFAAFLANLSGNTNFNYTPNLSDKKDWSFRSMTHNGSNEWLTSCGIPLLIGLVLLGIASLTVGIVVLVAVIVVLAVAFSLIFQLMVPVMYRQRCRALPAFREVIRLILSRPAPVILYLLFFIVLCLGAGVIACLSLLACCITLIPYVGTVVLLPVHVVLAAFPLLFLRQFGDAFDVWATVGFPAAPAPPPAAPSLPPPPIAPA
jgi:hypothetical protein